MTSFICNPSTYEQWNDWSGEWRRSSSAWPLGRLTSKRWRHLERFARPAGLGPITFLLLSIYICNSVGNHNLLFKSVSQLKAFRTWAEPLTNLNRCFWRFPHLLLFLKNKKKNGPDGLPTDRSAGLPFAQIAPLGGKRSNFTLRTWIPGYLTRGTGILTHYASPNSSNFQI